MVYVRTKVLFLGVVGCFIHATHSYNAGSSNYHQGDFSAYLPFTMPNPASYGQTGSSYDSENNCAKMPVIEVLDSIFCEHVNRKSYSSTIAPAIDIVINQLKLTKGLALTFDVINFISAAITELTSLQDAVQANYEDSSLLKPYFEFLSQSNSDTSATNSAGTESTAVEADTNAATDAKTLTESRITDMKKQEAEMMDKISKTSQASKQSGTQQDATSTKETKSSKSSVLSKLAGRSADESVSDVGTEAKTEDTSTSDVLEARSYKSNSDYNDYTCNLLPAVYCSTEKYDDVLYNIVEHFWRSLNFLFQASFETFDFMNQLDCSSGSWEDRWAFQQAATAYGALLVSIDTLINLASDVQIIYTIVELDQSDTSSYFRSGGSDIQQAPEMPPMNAPMQSPYNIYNPKMQPYPYRNLRSVPNMRAPAYVVG